MFDFLKKILGTAQSRILRKYEKTVREINQWEEKLGALSEEELRHKTSEFRERLSKGETLNDFCQKLRCSQKCLPPLMWNGCPCFWLQSKMGHDPL